MNRIFSLLLVTLLLQLTGCATYSHDDLSPVTQWPPAAASGAKPSLYLKVEGQYLFNGNATGAGFNQAKLAELVLKEYQGSEQFERATLAQQTSDIYASVQVTNHERGSMASAFITGFTLFIIPGKYSNTLTMETVFKDGQGTVLGRVEKHETMTTWMQLLLIFALPFNESADNVLTQLTQSSLEDAVKQGLLTGK
ncbi:hypothetical protein [Pseudomonas sp. ML96]|uniref:hypothetical protein n=1 Tax=Pseudomonas sp. ML96 TaxID=1523503 RepID=UPI0005BDA03B|nr:hypothetical protein [Pseudomonas sp. ML96]